MNIPIISILIPVYNREKVIAETLDSLIAQSFENWECILVDDGSRDNTLPIIGDYVKKDERFKCFKRPNHRKSGGCGARNYAFEKSQGQYIKWLDSDDILQPLLLEKEIKIFQQFPDVDFVYCDHTAFSTNKDKAAETIINIPDNSSGIDLLNISSVDRKYLIPGTYSHKRKIIAYSGLWNEEIRINQDGEFLFRILATNPKVERIPYFGFRYRLEGTDKITSNYNDLNKASLKLKSWELIDAQIKLRRTDDLKPYITNTKNFLYKYHLHLKQYSIILDFRHFFKDQIKNENRKRIKYQLLKTYLKSFLC